MNEIEKKLKSYYKASFKHENKVERAKALAGIETKKESAPLWKKAFFFPVMGALLSGASAAIIAGVAIGSQNASQVKADYVVSNKVVKLDLNPSISISTDQNGKVKGIYGNNDDGKLFTINKAYVGMDFTKAIEKILDDQVKTGYLVSGKQGLDCNKYSFVIYGENEDSALSAKIEKHIEDVLSSKNVKLGEEGITAGYSSDLKGLVENPYYQIGENDFEDSKEDVDDYYSKVSDYASDAVEEFYTLCYYYQDKISYFKTVLSELTTSWSEYSFYEGKINSLESSFMNYANVYESKFLIETSGYMSLYKNLWNERVNTFTYRMELAQSDDWSEAMEDALKSKEDTLNAAILALDTFRNGILGAYQSYLDTAVSDLNDFTELLKNSEEARAVISSVSFAKSYASALTNYITSFENHYKQEKESWITFMENEKNLLIEGIARFLR